MIEFSVWDLVVGSFFMGIIFVLFIEYLLIPKVKQAFANVSGKLFKRKKGCQGA